MKKIIAFIGPSGCGKSTIIQYVENSMPRIVTHTTRQPRDGEIPDVTYHYVTKEEFNKIEFVERVDYSGNYYGISKAEISEKWALLDTLCVVVERGGFKALVNQYGRDHVIGIFLHAPKEILAARMRLRGDTKEQVLERLANMEATGELEAPEGCVYQVSTNNKLKYVLSALQCIIASEAGIVIEIPYEDLE